MIITTMTAIRMTKGKWLLLRPTHLLMTFHAKNVPSATVNPLGNPIVDKNCENDFDEHDGKNYIEIKVMRVMKRMIQIDTRIMPIMLL